MKLTPALLLFAAASAPLAAQTTTAKPAARPAGAATTHTAAGAACAKLPEISPKVPALPASAGCPKHLYTITTVPSVKIDYVSPMEGNTLKEALGIEPTTFSLDYVDTKIGTGELAGSHSFYTINYTGYLADGTKFDSSFDHGEPITIQYGSHQVIAGWDTGLNGMRVGGHRRLFIPYELGYGTQGKGPIPPKSMLIFDVQLEKISETPPPPKPKPAAPTPPEGAKQPAAAQPGAPAAVHVAPATSAPVTGAPATPPATPPATTPPPTTPKP